MTEGEGPAVTIFAPKPRDPVVLEIGGETVDITRIPMGTLIKVLDLVGTDPTRIAMGSYEKTLTAASIVCEPQNSRVTKAFLLELDAFDEVIPAMTFVMNYVDRRAAEYKSLSDPKNRTDSSS